MATGTLPVLVETNNSISTHDAKKFVGYRRSERLKGGVLGERSPGRG